MALQETWDRFVATAPMATFLHTRRFLSYHSNRLKDVSLLILDNKEKVAGVFPAALDPLNERRVISHPGATFGGLVHTGRLKGEALIDGLLAVKNHYETQGFQELCYKAVPYIYHRIPSQDDLYALFRVGAQRYRCDLSATIDLAHRGKVSVRRRRGYKKARKAGLEVTEGVKWVEPLWKVLKQNLWEKHNAKPVHTVEEIGWLYENFPEEVEFVVATVKGEVIAGIVLFQAEVVSHVQYIAANQPGYITSALDMVFEYSIERARKCGKRYIDFGISNERDGKFLNEGLYQFKTEFGAGGVAYEFYEITLDGK